MSDRAGSGLHSCTEIVARALGLCPHPTFGGMQEPFGLHLETLELHPVRNLLKFETEIHDIEVPQCAANSCCNLQSTSADGSGPPAVALLSQQSVQSQRNPELHQGVFQACSNQVDDALLGKSV